MIPTGMIRDLRRIEDVGPDGQFMDSEHTYRHFREDWYPELLDRRTYDNWAAAGATTLQERARQKVNKILASHEAPRLAEAIEEGVKAVTVRAAAAL